LLNFTELPIIVPIEGPRNQHKNPISHFHIVVAGRQPGKERGTIWRSTTGWLYKGKIGYLPKSSSALDYLPKIDCTLVNYPLRT
jgi:hypothetical protein